MTCPKCGYGPAEEETPALQLYLRRWCEDMAKTRLCNTCGATKPLTEFHRQETMCKICYLAVLAEEIRTEEIAARLAPGAEGDGGNDVTKPTILQGYSYPCIPLAAVIAYEAHWGRTVEIAVEHAGGWTVTGESAGAGCTCRGYPGDDDGCPVHGEPR